MSSTRPPRTSSLLQDVPGSFPSRSVTENYDDDEEEPEVQTLSEAVYARRAEYVRPASVRIKIGTWNVAAHKGAETDVGDWFVRSRGVSEALSGLNLDDQSQSQRGNTTRQTTGSGCEDIESQEARFREDEPSVPRGDLGSGIPGREDIGLYVLGLQEVVDINSVTEAVRPYTDPAAAKKWKDAMLKALPKGYSLVAEQQLIGLLLLVYASPQIAKDVKSVSTTSVGTGVLGYMGNKGAVTARIVLGETTRLVFIDSHLAAGADKTSLERRNWDAQQIVQRTRFDPIQDAMDLSQSTGEQIGEEDFAFWMGDLNYRLEGIPGDDVRRILMLHTRSEYDLSQQPGRKVEEEIKEAAASSKRASEYSLSVDSASSIKTMSPRSSVDTEPSTITTAPSTIMDDNDDNETSQDPTSLQTTLSSLLPHDELHQQMKARKAFHDGWREGPITFLPTYKYDVGSVGIFDSSEKKRAPSWCDRILYRTRTNKLAYDTKIKDEETARKKDEEMTASGLNEAGNDEEILYDYDPEMDGTTPNDEYEAYDEYDDGEHGVVITKQGYEDEIHLEYYMAHQRVLSSDHKPLDAVFLLKYDAVVPELKAAVHSEVAKELDKAENEGRPNVTVVADRHRDTQTEQSDASAGDFEGVWFGGVRWGQAKHRNITIANTSRVAATFNFLERSVDRNQSSGIAPSWLNLSIGGVAVASGSSTTTPIILEPGETANIELEIRILDIALVQALNDGSRKLDDILVLRVEGGRDHFIPIKAKWLETSLGRTVDKLIRIPEGGIRKLQSQKPDSGKSAKTTDTTSGDPSAKARVADEEPVRFSAPRELFRLTEAIEELGARVIAEWDMTAGDESEIAPWSEHPAWPFDEECWTERSTSQWQDGISDACNALDTDEPLEASLASEMPRKQRLYVLASLLLLFLQSMPDGIIDVELWGKLDAYFTENEKAKQKPSSEERRMAVQEVLSQSPAHSISFILITTMLDRLQAEIAGTGKDSRGEPRTPTSPASPSTRQSPLRRLGVLGGRLPAEAKSEHTVQAWAKVFAEVVVKHPVSADKHKATRDRRKSELLEVFLESK